MRISQPINTREALTIYLQDHRAGAQAGVALARRAARNPRRQRTAPALRNIAADIEHDEHVLRGLMERLDARPSPMKNTMGVVVERLGRLKLNGQLLGSSPLSPLTELEVLLSGVRAKRDMWTALREVADGRFAGVDLDEMIERAEDQIDRLSQLRLESVRRAFLGPSEAKL